MSYSQNYLRYTFVSQRRKYFQNTLWISKFESGGSWRRILFDSIVRAALEPTTTTTMALQEYLQTTWFHCRRGRLVDSMDTWKVEFWNAWRHSYNGSLTTQHLSCSYSRQMTLRRLPAERGSIHLTFWTFFRSFPWHFVAIRRYFVTQYEKLTNNSQGKFVYFFANTSQIL